MNDMTDAMSIAGTTGRDPFPKWTQDEAIAYECACECINEMKGIKLAEIYEEESKPTPDTAKLARLEAERSRLNQERKNLRLKDHAQVARIRSEYGAIIRSEYAREECVAAP